MTKIRIRPFENHEAETVASWSYEPPFDFYNGDPSQFADYLHITEEGFGYYAITRDDPEEVIGFCCFGPEARVIGQDVMQDVLDIGGGLRPDLLSAGLATSLFPEIVKFARLTFNGSLLRTAIATFNERSVRLCVSAGFILQRKFDGPGREFCELTRPANER